VYKIVKATTEDVPLIRELAFKVWPQTYAPILTLAKIEYMLDLMYSEKSLQNQMKDGAEFIIVYEDQEPVGFASYQEMKPTIFKLHKIYVLPNQQGKGTGRFIIDDIIGTIQPGGATALQLQVNRDNKARYFYEKLGFTIIEEIDLDIGNGHYMNDYVMEKKLNIAQ
jgi:diamine N-acetyltransferase